MGSMMKVHKTIPAFLIALNINFGLMAEEKSSLEEGEIYFQKKDYAKAAIYLDQALLNQEEEKNVSEIRLKLAKCYLEIAKDTKQSEKNQSDHFEKSESILLNLRELENNDQLKSILARTYIIHGIQLRHEEALEKGRNLILSMDGGEYPQLLLAEASSNHADKKEIYTQIIRSTRPSYRWHGIGWYLMGLNELAQGGDHLSQASEAFEEAYSQLYPKELHLAALCLKYKAEAFAGQQTKEGDLRALSELNLLIQSNGGELLSHLEDPGEIFYLRGLIAAQLFQQGAGLPFGEIAEKSLNEGLKSYSKGKYVPETMKTLGILYYRQQKMQEAADIFEKLVKTYSTSPEAEEALLWLSTCVDGEKGKLYLRKLYTDYPGSKYADEAFFRYYSFDDYIKGSDETVEHLSRLKEKFPQSKYLILSNHLLGHHYKIKNDLETAADNFEDSEKVCEIHDNQDHYFKEIATQSALERALILLELERMDESEIILKRLVDAQIESNEITPILQKVVYHLVNIYVKEHQDDNAEKLINMMLKKHEKSKMSEGYYISRLWYERGMIAKRENSPKQALQYFTLSEMAAKGDILETSQLLDLWIQQSLCHLELGEMDKSMLILSRVTNYNATSSLRVKAMYLRAEIYERQGRYELAKKQLQATSTKGGEWALKAKQKLEKDYVQHQHSG
jgi:TolA-binding protein